jgi:uncharacterized coiled-coil DUF342 family protein
MTDEQLDELWAITDVLSRNDRRDLHHIDDYLKWEKARHQYWELIDGTKGSWEFENQLITALRAARAERDEYRQAIARIEPKVDVITEQVVAQQSELAAADKLLAAVQAHLRTPEYYASVDLMESAREYNALRQVSGEGE